MPVLINSLCFIHSTLGEHKKTNGLSGLPYSFVETPTGVYAGVVYNSMAAVRNIGEPLSAQKEKLTEYFNLTIQHKNESMRPGELDAQVKAMQEGTMVAPVSPSPRSRSPPPAN